MTESQPLPERSQLSLRSDGVVELELSVVASDSFATAAEAVFTLLRTAQARHPGALRSLTVSIEGHAGERAGYDADFFEFQQEFLLGALGRHFTWIQLPLTGSLANPDAQQDDIADRLQIDKPADSPT